jgi:hypothetical protein
MIQEPALVNEENRKRNLSPVARREERERVQRKNNLQKHGVIPEYIKISEIYQVYTAFT